MAHPILLVGNGPNRVSRDAHSWQAVLQRLADETGQPSVMHGSESRPFTLLFEELALRRARRGGSEEELKELVAGWMRELRPNGVHTALMSLPISEVLTTNYDYTLETAVDHASRCVDFHSESRYSLFRCRRAGMSRIWHMHGEVDKPATIMLGHDHYVGYLHKARGYLTSLSARPVNGKYDYRSPVIHGSYDFEQSPSGFSWLDLFIRDDVHIVGFGCQYSEIAIWWLIGYKERLRLSQSRVPKGIAVGRTRYYYFSEDAEREPLKGQLQVLHDMGVELASVRRGAGYEEGWERLVNSVARAL